MHSVLISCITSQHHKWLFTLLEGDNGGDHGESNLRFLGEKWVQYITRISANEGLTEKHLDKNFMDHMGEFYGNKGIR